MDTLQLKRRSEPGIEFPFTDFIVSGKSLFDVFHAQELPGLLGWVKNEEKIIDQFLLKAPVDLSGNRQRFYVCKECADIGCGAITGRIREEGDTMKWEDFGFENNYDERMSRFNEYKHIGPFTFDKGEYTKVFENYRSQICST